MTVGQSITEALRAVERRKAKAGTSQEVRSSATQRRVRVGQLLESVQLPGSRADDLPGALSCGQRQRVALARALAADPAFILADEITSALDVSVQGSVLNLLVELQAEQQFGLLFISHNLAVVRYLCDEVAVIRQGKLVESGLTDQVLQSPREEYTRQLLAAVPGIGEPLFAGSSNVERTSL
ncbi:dipeptide transport ATP-binding protein [Renibacterium salmoninarum ATCC 33209]|uniref:Dipeptide transport ATP-binding protein n=1 Tax=Renibacterium salmoninarum (strain ATCC 33209 / DSM 20767 / JCM 11484 / NBRC 15589 / NCIMB 2235) TaxID=288705 RepID=A9WPS9_RENSM|nr:dipeptide transport ATP-binding protein [Renibacterium salmoninarum ATCC 33209]